MTDVSVVYKKNMHIWKDGADHDLAVNSAPAHSRLSDCESLFRVTVTPSTQYVVFLNEKALLIWLLSTITETVSVTSTETTVQTTEAAITVTASAVASKRWEEQREALNILLRRAPPRTSSSVTAAQKTPSYASACASPAAYSSACSCLGVKHTTISASAPKTTTTVSVKKTATVTKIATIVTTETYVVASNSTVGFSNSTRAAFINSTALASSNTSSLNSTLSHVSSSTSEGLTTSSDLSDKGSTIVSSNIPSTTRLASSDSHSASETTTLSSKVGAFANSTTSAILGNSTSSVVISNSTAPFLNGSSTTANAHTSSDLPIVTSVVAALNATSTGRFLNSTAPMTWNATVPSTQVHAANTTSAPFLNATAPAGLVVNTTSAPFLNATSASFSNASTTAPFLNATSAPILNVTTSAPFLNATTVPWLNTTQPPVANSTAAPYLNSTSVRFSNTSTPAATPTSTSTLDLSCGETTPPFLLQVSQPSSVFNGWYAKISGDQILFSSSANHSDKFSVESSGHLCAVGYFGESGTPAIAIVETKDSLSGSAVYFVDGHRLTNLTGLGYGALDCAVDDDLACQAQDMSHWVACGLGLDISSDGSQNVVVDNWNCSSVSLSAVYN
ncbi:putative Ig-like domain-containing protein [Seiridium unicorne]|uniref:Ig-like domain-containing protein n=1 Tax=Seiridium unicorne TaxID=138068 RepID=A0ABR2UVM5_9PEZI